MGVFIVLLFVPMIIQHVKVKGYDINYERKNKWAIAFFFVFLTLLVMLRHESVGNDTGNYINTFNSFRYINWDYVSSVGYESGFSYFTKIISVFTQDPQLYLAIAAIIISVMIYPTYKRLCLDTSLTVVMFVVMSTFVMMFSGIRQMLAVGIGFIAYEFTRRKKLIPFILAVLLALSFHTSALMLIFMYPLYHARITKKWLYAVVPAMILIFAYNSTIFSFLTLILERYTRFDIAGETTGAYTMLILFAIFTVFAFLIPDESAIDSETIGLRNFLLLSLVIQMFAPLHSLAMRMSYYYIIFIPLLIPKIISFKSQRWSQVAVWARHIMVLFFVLYFFFIKANSGGNLHVFPYHFFWENV